MDILTRQSFQSLMVKNAGQCVSIYMPTHRGGAQTREDVIRLKNLLRQAEEHLAQNGVRAPEAKELVEPARKLLEDKPFWQYMGDGLALFLAPKDLRYYRLPLRFEELVVVTTHWHVKPLLPLLTEDGRFCLLTLSKKAVRLLSCTRHHWREVELRDVPKSLGEFLRFDVPEKHLQFHAGGATRGQAVAAGRGGGPDEALEKNKVLEYFRQLDNGVCRLLNGQRAPLVLAGVQYLRGIYREANHYAPLMEEGIDGNPDGRSDEELHNLAWRIVEPHFLEARDDAAAQFRQLAGTERASKDLRKIVPAAYQGRVGLLLVGAGAQCWGLFQPGSDLVELHPDERPGDQELLDFAATHALLHGGAVYAVGPDHLPDDSPVAAVFRH